ncbi:hypothetical protein [Demequina sp.]|uniref:hypothetical protein n=1 Tax=Demequina sp. TaxID=2050685 RepID=UPI0025CDDC1B|nr:hypothetical protein [Demequina sp.]
MTSDHHRAGFAAFTGALIAEFGRYLDGPDVDPVGDAVSYRQVPLWLDHDDLARLAFGFATLLVGFATQDPGEGRSRHVLSLVLHPTPP